MEQTTNDSNDKGTEKAVSFEQIIKEIGECGRYQISVGVAAGLVLAFGSFTIMNFVFSSFVPDHRCYIPECESIDSNIFDAEWMKYAIPHEGDRPESCMRYQFIDDGDSNGGSCNEGNFNRSHVVPCDSYIVRDNEQRAVSQLNMLCTGQDNKMAFVGTASTLGRVLAMPATGLISDKFGRLLTIVMCSVLGAIFSSLQIIPAPFMSFELYWTLEFLASVSTTGVVGACMVFTMEWTSAEYRVRFNTMAVLLDTMSPLFIGLLAWYFSDNFIAYKLLLAAPGFLFISLYFVFGESPQWLIGRHKYDKAIDSLSKAGRINGKPLQEHTIQLIRNRSVNNGNSIETTSDETESKPVSIVDLLKEKTLAFRLFILSLVWLFTYFALFGLLLGSTKVHENKYLSYILIGVAEMPSALIAVLLLDRIGRRYTIGTAILLYCFLLILSTQLSMNHGFYQLLLYIFSKTAITTALIGLYTYSIELWPTAVRNTAFNICEMVGRFGTMLSTLCVILFESTSPLYISAAIIGAILLFAFLPETVHCKKLPDTIDEALAIGKGGDLRNSCDTDETDLKSVE